MSQDPNGEPALNQWTEAFIQVVERVANADLPADVNDFKSIHQSAFELALVKLQAFLEGKPSDNSGVEDFKDVHRRHRLSPVLLGDVYQRLLDYRPELREGRMVLVAGKGLRKSSGRYYTPRWLVETC